MDLASRETAALPTTTDSPLLNLAGEIRNKIYHCVLELRSLPPSEASRLSSMWDEASLPSWHETMQCRHGADTATPLRSGRKILLLNRQIHDEASVVLYRQNTMHLTMNEHKVIFARDKNVYDLMCLLPPKRQDYDRFIYDMECLSPVEVFNPPFHPSITSRKRDRLLTRLINCVHLDFKIKYRESLSTTRRQNVLSHVSRLVSGLSKNKTLSTLRVTICPVKFRSRCGYGSDTDQQFDLYKGIYETNRAVQKRCLAIFGQLRGLRNVDFGLVSCNLKEGSFQLELDDPAETEKTKLAMMCPRVCHH